MRISENIEEDYMDEIDARRSALLITSILDRLEIKYWFDYGALLGTVRNHKFIPWDTDIEINFKYVSEEQINNLIHYLKSYYSIDSKKKDYYLHIEPKQGLVGMSLSWFPENTFTKVLGFICYHLPTKVRMGIIKLVQEIYCKSTNETIRPDDGEDREQSWHCRAIRQMLPIFFCYKTRPEKLYDMEVMVPEKAEELLYLRYGKEWRIPMKKYRSYTT